MKIWFDITNTPQVHFLLAILDGLEKRGYEDFLISARDFSETKNLLSEKTEYPFTVIGSHLGNKISSKAIGLINRFYKVYKNYKVYDTSISCGSEGAIWSSFLRNRKSIAFGDNDLAKQWTYSLFVDHAIFPKSIPKRVLIRQGIRSEKLYQYDGFKEHVYIANYVPDNRFKDQLPFKDYVIVRPENIQANYVTGKYLQSITPQLLNQLTSKGINVIYLPRYKSDYEYAVGRKNIHIPEGAVNGLDACYYSNGVFTGAGTFAREAACLGIPSFSFFMGKNLLAVDKDLIAQNKMYYSRNPDHLVDQFIKSNKKSADLKKAKEVNSEVLSKTIEFLNK